MKGFVMSVKMFVNSLVIFPLLANIAVICSIVPVNNITEMLIV